MILSFPTFEVCRDSTGAVELLDGLPAIRVTTCLRFVDTDGTERVVPPEFKGNGGSTPWGLRLFLHPHTVAALYAFHIHDHDYADPSVTRWRADCRLFIVLRCFSVPFWLCIAAWIGVRVGGGSHRAFVGHPDISWNGLKRKVGKKYRRDLTK